MTADVPSGRGFPGAEQGPVVGPKEPQGYPSLRGLDSSQVLTQLNDQPPPDDADGKQVCHCFDQVYTRGLLQSSASSF